MASLAIPLSAVGWLVLVLGGALNDPTSDASTTTLRTVLVVAVPVALGVGALYAVWRLRLEQLASRPGPILVTPLLDHTRGAGTRDSPLARRLSGEFQRCLADTRLYKSTAIPTSGTSTEFLDVVEQVGDSLSVVWSPVVGLFRLLCPVSAFQVRCELLPPRVGDGVAAKVVHVELVRLPASSLAPALIVESTWERAIEHAAHRVAAAVLPRTGECRTPPWTMWRGLRLPRGLFDLVQRFHSELDQRRFDEAQATLRQALRLDPGNLALRLELGKLQEKMAMHLDALLTYDDIVSLASRTDRGLSRWWNPPDGHLEAWTDEGRAPGLRASHPVVLVARYRHALLLGLGDKLAAQWWDRPLGCTTGEHFGARERRRDYLRRILAYRLRTRYAGIDETLRHDDSVTLRRFGYLSADRSGFSRTERATAAIDSRIFFTTVGVMELERLLEGRRRRRLRRHRRTQRGVLPTRSLELAVLATSLRRWMAFAHAHREQTHRDAGSRRALESVLHRTDARSGPSPGRPFAVDGVEVLAGGRWPPRPDDVARIIRRILSARGGLLRSWIEHYNAACIYALLLLPPDPFRAAESKTGADPTIADVASALSVDELLKAVACSDSGYLGSQRDWVVAEDPDLDQLRSRPEFRDFEAQTYGSVASAAQRGPRVGIWEQSAHVADVISSSAGKLADLWRHRSHDLDPTGTSTPPNAVLKRWLEAERDSWRLAENLAVDHRDWSTRHAIGRRIDAWADEAGIDLSRRPQPTYSDALLARQLSSMKGERDVRPFARVPEKQDRIAKGLRRAMIRMDHRLEQLADDVREGAPPPGVAECCGRRRALALTSEWGSLDAAFVDDEAVPDPALVRAWCRASRLRWQALSSWFDDDVLGGGDLDERRDHFRAAVARGPFGFTP